MNNNFINVHTFDGKLKGIFTPLHVYTNDEKKTTFTQCLSLISDPFAKQTIQTMINDLTNSGGSNYQPENNLDSSDILMDLLQWKENPDVIVALNEQLADVKKLGICPSGRVTRLLQLWVAFNTKNDENKKEK